MIQRLFAIWMQIIALEQHHGSHPFLIKRNGFNIIFYIKGILSQRIHNKSAPLTFFILLHQSFFYRIEHFIKLRKNVNLNREAIILGTKDSNCVLVLNQLSLNTFEGFLEKIFHNLHLTVHQILEQFIDLIKDVQVLPLFHQRKVLFIPFVNLDDHLFAAAIYSLT